MHYLEEIQTFKPTNEQEQKDYAIMMKWLREYGDTALFRENEVAHLTSSGFVMNHELTKVLLVHHNIMDTWAWTGGHADGETDMLKVALKEVAEETGVQNAKPLFSDIAALDILPVFGHFKKGKYVSTHLHLSVGYVVVCDENEEVRIKEDENTGVKWFPIEHFTTQHFSPHDVYLYNKLIARAIKQG